MHTLTRIVGHATDNETAHRLHDIEHHGVVHYILLNKQDTLRHRLRITTDKGTEVAIALPRSEQLTNGAVLMLGTDCAIVVRIQETTWLKLRARDNAAALELGYFAGLASLAGVFAVVFVVLNLMLSWLIIRPIRNMSLAANKISTGDFDVPEFRSGGRDEVAVLGSAFNRMRRSLDKAMKMIEQGD